MCTCAGYSLRPTSCTCAQVDQAESNLPVRAPSSLSSCAARHPVLEYLLTKLYRTRAPECERMQRRRVAGLHERRWWWSETKRIATSVSHPWFDLRSRSGGSRMWRGRGATTDDSRAQEDAVWRVSVFALNLCIRTGFSCLMPTRSRDPLATAHTSCGPVYAC